MCVCVFVCVCVCVYVCVWINVQPCVIQAFVKKSLRAKMDRCADIHQTFVQNKWQEIMKD
jgi:hypothetical protein